MAKSILQIIIEAKDKSSQMLGKVGMHVEKLGEKFHDISGKLTIAGGVITGFFGAIAKSSIESAAKFEQYQVAMSNAMGSQEKMIKTMAMLEELSAKTPFQLDQITESYIKMTNRGFEPTRAELVKLGDLASSQAKSFDQLVEAMLDAQSGEFERLKEFGIRAKNNGDTVQFSFKGITTEVQNSESAIKDYILSLGDLKGVTGGMEQQAGTFNGKMSTLKDTIDLTAKSVGDVLLPQLSPLLDKSISIVEKLGARVKTNPELAAGVVKRGLAIGGALIGLGALGAALPVIAAGFAAITGPIGLASAALGVRVNNVKYIVDHRQDIKNAMGVQGFSNAMAESLSPGYGANKARISTAVATGIPTLVKNPYPSLLPRRASGGPVSAGTAYLVGENGEETFVPGVSGTIIPADLTGKIKKMRTTRSSIGNQISPGVYEDNSYGSRLRRQLGSLSVKTAEEMTADRTYALAQSLEAAKSYSSGLVSSISKKRGASGSSSSGYSGSVPGLDTGITINIGPVNIYNATDLEGFKQIAKDAVVEAVRNLSVGYA